MKNKIPSGATTHIFKTGKVVAGKLDRSNIEIKQNPMNTTDHVSYNPPDASKPNQREYDLAITAPKYAKNH